MEIPNKIVKVSNLPTVAELFEQSDNIQKAFQHEQLNALLNAEPKKEWVKKHPYIRDYNYIPIGIIEFLIKKIFKKYNIEILREGVAFNGVYVVIRLHYLNPVTSEMEYHDGIGAVQLQTKTGTSPADLVNVNQGAISMAFPIAKTIAIKDASDHFGKLFGSDLNRKDTIPFSIDENLSKKANKEKDRIGMMIQSCKTLEELSMLQEAHPDTDITLFSNRREELNK